MAMAVVVEVHARALGQNGMIEGCRTRGESFAGSCFLVVPYQSIGC